MRCALVGLGMVAPTHVAALNGAEGASLAGIMARTADNAARFASEHAPGIRIYETARQIADDPDVDAVIVATPPDARHDLVTLLAAAGKPMLLEKPLERSFTAARALVETCERKSVPLGVVLQHRSRAEARTLKARVEGGDLGDIATVEIRVPWWRDQAYYDTPGRGTYARDGGGVMLTQAIHTLDLAQWICGPVARVQAMTRTTPLHNLEAEDWAGGLLQFQGGAAGTLMATTAAFPGSAESIAVHGTRGSAELVGGTLMLHHHDGRRETFGAREGTGGGADPMAFTHAWHQAVIEDFAQALQRGRAPLAPGRDALRTHALIAALEEAGRNGTATQVAPT